MKRKGKKRRQRDYVGGREIYSFKPTPCHLGLTQDLSWLCQAYSWALNLGVNATHHHHLSKASSTLLHPDECTPTNTHTHHLRGCYSVLQHVVVSLTNLSKSPVCCKALTESLREHILHHRKHNWILYRRCRRCSLTIWSTFHTWANTQDTVIPQWKKLPFGVKVLSSKFYPGKSREISAVKLHLVIKIAHCGEKQKRLTPSNAGKSPILKILESNLFFPHDNSNDVWSNAMLNSKCISAR